MDYLVNIASMLLLFAILGISFNWLIGYGGMFSIAHGAFFGIGGYTAAILETRLGLPVLAAVPCAVAVTVIVGAALGYTALRVSGEYLIIASFGLQQVASSIFVNAQPLTGGAGGSSVPTGFAYLGLDPGPGALLAIAVLAAIVLGSSVWLARRPIGNAIRAMREDEDALEATGHSVGMLKIGSHAISFGVAGLAGVLYAHMLQFIAPDDFSLTTSVTVLTIVAIGGAANSFGPLLGALVAIGLPELLTYTPLPSNLATPIRGLFFGLLLIGFMRFRRNGLLNEDYRPTRLSLTPALAPSDSAGGSDWTGSGQPRTGKEG